MEHILDNPAWNALISWNKNLSYGNEEARYFDKELSPFSGIKEPTLINFNTLYDIAPLQINFGFVTPVEISFPAQWKVARHMRVLQMTYNKPAPKVDENNVVALGETHVPAMLALTKLTNPGPFNSRTIEFGHYRGIFDGDQLVAMAGQRMHPFNYAEISAVCTHPDHLGKGYSSKLLLSQVNRIQTAQEIPFLHVLTDNIKAINVYKKVGFETRKEMSIYIIQKL